jgi:hypothetical protein
MNALANLIEPPTPADRKAFAALTIVADRPTPGAPPAERAPTTFTRAQLKLIKEALTVAETTLLGRSLELGTMADEADRAGKKTRFRVRADELFCKSCDCRDLADKIAEAMRGQP